MNRIALYHHSHLSCYRSPFGAAVCGSPVAFAMDVSGLPADCVCSLRLWFQETGESMVPMTADAPDANEPDEQAGAARRYSVVVNMPDTPGLLWYYFVVQSSAGNVTRYYGNNAAGSGGEGCESFSPPASYQITVFEESPVPDWWKEGLVYQIFVDRFARGLDWKNRALDAIEGGERNGPTRILQLEWRDDPFLYKDDRGWVMRWPFFGGTLEGIRERLSYLRGLGVTTIYLNPIFEAASSHKYDTGDYMKVDPGYGDEDIFRLLTREAAERGISVILDGVFSHTGADSIYFNRYGNYPSVGAYQSEDSPYRDWYRFNETAEGYESWWGVADLPNVEETAPSYQEFIWGGEDSVIRHWLRAGARGWRLDVADEMPDVFIRNIKQALRETCPDGLLLGEVWEDASNKRSYGVMREYFLGKELDATMNYPFRDRSLDFALNRLSPGELHTHIMSLYENYPRENFYACLNLIGSHDRTRVLTVLGGAEDETGMTEWQKQTRRLRPDQYDLAKRRLKLLSAWQMTFPGVPSIFYGDEAGVEGYSDPYNRAPYPWGNEDEALLNHYRALGRLRAEYEVFRRGDFVSYGGYRHTYAFSRELPARGERALVFLNGSRDADEEIVIVLREGENVFVELLSGDMPEPEDVFAEAAETPAPPKPLETLSLGLRVTARDAGAGDAEAAGAPARALRFRIGPVEARVVYIRQARPETLVMKNLPRAAGLLCHVTSLPSPYGCGDFGKAAYDFCDFLAASGQRVWQVLPLTTTGGGDSPYSGGSAFAGNELLIDCAALARDYGLGDPPEGVPVSDRADFAAARALKYPVFERAFEVFDENDSEYRAFCDANAYWLYDYCLFRAIEGEQEGRPWQDWPVELAQRHSEALDAARERLGRAAAFRRFLQYQFFKQWRALRAYATERGIRILGDTPIYVSADSCDTWVHRRLFDLSEDGRLRKSGGVPPDAFSEDGQNWKNPVFDWRANADEGYAFWIERFRRSLALYDFLRLDHFRGFEACWEIPEGAETAKAGDWIKGPGKALFEAAEAALGPLPILAEDLGYITANVRDLKNTFVWPGMKIWQFHADEMVPAKPVSRPADTDADKDAAADESVKAARPAPKLADFLQVFYTGTHDNDTLAGFLAARHAAENPEAAPLTEAEIAARCAEITERLYDSDALWVILPLQDVACLGAEARMNTPGVAEGNWSWRAGADAFSETAAAYLRGLAARAER